MGRQTLSTHSSSAPQEPQSKTVPQSSDMKSQLPAGQDVINGVQQSPAGSQIWPLPQQMVPQDFALAQQTPKPKPVSTQVRPSAQSVSLSQAAPSPPGPAWHVPAAQMPEAQSSSATHPG